MAVTLRDINQQIRLGEDGRRQFKRDVHNADSLAADMVAFSNSSGGTILIGVSDDGSIAGLDAADVRRINQLIGNAASQHVRSPISPVSENVAVGKGRVVIVLRVREGIDKPYFDRQGVIWVKAGSDKRRIQSKEELRRLFQDVDLVHADQVPTDAGIERLDRLRFRDFLRKVYEKDMPEGAPELEQLLSNMNLAVGGKLNLAGLLLFADRPHTIKPAFTVKAVRYPGLSVETDAFEDSEDFEGPLEEVFKGALAFIMRSLPKRQAGSVNEPGRPAVPRIVFEELLVNALIHRDYFIQAPVRLFLFTDRMEIVNPGNLPNHLTVEKVRAGNSVIRNPILTSFAAKGLLPYRGLGTGIRRALAEWQAIEFVDDREACTFTARIGLSGAHDEPKKTSDKVQNDSKKHEIEPGKGLFDPQGEPIKGVAQQIVAIVAARPRSSYDDLAHTLGVSRSTVMRHIQELKARGVLERLGARKAGYWEVHVGESP